MPFELTVATSDPCDRFLRVCSAYPIKKRALAVLRSYCEGNGHGEIDLDGPMWALADLSHLTGDRRHHSHVPQVRPVSPRCAVARTGGNRGANAPH